MKREKPTGGVRPYATRISFLIGFVAGMFFTLVALAFIALFVLRQRTGSGSTAEQIVKTTGAAYVHQKKGG